MRRNGLVHQLSQIWQLPGAWRWMDPLPIAHRRGIVLSAIIILLAFLWPSSVPPQTVRETLAPPPAAQQGTPLQANIVDNSSALTHTATTDKQGQWRNFTVADGQTLAQLFRNNNLQVNDVFAMAQVEGEDKPLSNLQRGQTVSIRIDYKGIVTGLRVDSSNGSALFIRQPDGSFIRAG